MKTARPKFASVFFCLIGFIEASVVHAKDWAAFIGPDLPVVRQLHADFAKRAASRPSLAGLEIRQHLVDQSAADGEAGVAAIVRQNPAVILAASGLIAHWVKRTGTTTPVIFSSPADPVRVGLVQSNARPGGNLTGIAFDLPTEGKQVELLKELRPGIRSIAILDNGEWETARSFSSQKAEFERALGVKLIHVVASDAQAMTAQIQLVAPKVDAWLVPLTNLAIQMKTDLVTLLRSTRKPALYGRRQFPEAGALASYQEVIADPMGVWLEMLELVRKGVSPGDIPIRRPKDFQFVLNIAEARRLGLALSPSLLRRADVTLTAP